MDGAKLSSSALVIWLTYLLACLSYRQAYIRTQKIQKITENHHKMSMKFVLHDHSFHHDEGVRELTEKPALS